MEENFLIELVHLFTIKSDTVVTIALELNRHGSDNLYHLFFMTDEGIIRMNINKLDKDVYTIFYKYNIISIDLYVSNKIKPVKRTILHTNINKRIKAIVYAVDDDNFIYSIIENTYSPKHELYYNEYVVIDYTNDNFNIIDEI